MKAIVFDEESKGSQYEYSRIPAETRRPTRRACATS